MKSGFLRWNLPLAKMLRFAMTTKDLEYYINIVDNYERLKIRNSVNADTLLSKSINMTNLVVLF